MTSFIDLREHLAEMATEPQPLAGLALPLRGRMVDLGADGMSLALGTLLPGSGEVRENLANLFLLVTEGRLELDGAAGPLSLAAGECAVLPQGMAWRWSAQAAVTLVLQGCVAPAGTASGPLRIDPGIALAPSGKPPAALLTTAAPDCHAHEVYETADEVWSVGLWAATPYARRGLDYDFSEMMLVLEGGVTITDAAGRARRFGVGDLFIVPRGAHCAWHNDEAIRKIYVTHRPAG